MYLKCHLTIFEILQHFQVVVSHIEVASVCLKCQAKGLLKTGQVVRRLRDAYNRQDLSCSHTDTQSDSAVSCAQIIRDLLVLLNS